MNSSICRYSALSSQKAGSLRSLSCSFHCLLAHIRLTMMLACLLTLTLHSHASTFVSGNVSGTWTKTGSPYVATANLTVSSGQTLTIQPGVTVIIGQGLMIDVEGTITAIGTAAERIVIRGANSTLYWDKIYINSTGAGQSAFSNCILSDGNYGLYLNIYGNNGTTTFSQSISNCTFSNFQNSCIYGHSQGWVGFISQSFRSYNTTLSPQISNSIFKSSTNGSLFLAEGTSYYTMGYNYAYGATDPVISNCNFSLITGEALNFTSGSQAATSYPNVQNNIFIECGTALKKASGTLFNDITAYNCFYNNQANFIGFQAGIYGTISGTNARGSGCDLAYNIFEDPIFAETVTYSLANNSPCIDAGNPDAAYSDTTLPPSKGTTVNDMGIYGGPNAGNWVSNEAPVLAAIPAQTASEGLVLNFTASATDVDLPANPLTYSLIGAPSGASINPTTGVFDWTPTEAQGPGSFNFTVKVSDGSLIDDQVLTVTVNEVNIVPSLSVITPKTMDESTLLTFTANAADSDIPVNTLIYSLVSAPVGAGINASTGEFSWTPTEAQGPGIFDFTVRVSDGQATSDQAVSVTVNEVNLVPVLAVITDKNVNETSLLAFTALGSDSDLPVNPLSYSLEAGAPTGAAINPTTGEFSWTPTEAQGPGTYPITVRVSDTSASAVNSPSLQATRTFSVTVDEINAAPEITLIPAQFVNEGTSLNLTVTATDQDLPLNTLTYSLTGPAYGATINSTTGAFTWTPTEVQGPGSFNFTVEVSDGVLTDDQSVSVTVNEVNLAPVLADISAKLVDESTALAFTATATDADIPANALVYSLGAGAPSGATIHPSTGVFSWNAPAVASDTHYTVRVVVSDNGSPVLSDYQDVSILVRVVDDVIRWRREKFGDDADNPVKETTVWGDYADPDNDGTGNLLEFMMARNPIVPDENLGPKFRIENGKAIMTYHETKLTDHGIFLFGNWSPDLKVWLYAGLEYVIVEDRGDHNLMEIRVPVNRQKQLFQRLELYRAY